MNNAARLSLQALRNQANRLRLCDPCVEGFESMMLVWDAGRLSGAMLADRCADDEAIAAHNESNFLRYNYQVRN